MPTDNILIVKIDSLYCDYLRKFDSKVSYNAGDKVLRPFVEVLFQINELNILHRFQVQRESI